MTINELKEKVAESENLEWLQSYTINVQFSHINFKSSIKGVVSIYEFITNQVEGFSKLEQLPRELTDVKNIFTEVQNKVVQLVKNKNINQNQWNSDLNRILNTNPPKFLYNSPETELLIRINQINPNYYNGAYEYLTGNTQNPTNKNYFIGYLMAYGFLSKDFSLLNQTDSEEKSISSIRNDFQKSLNDSESQMTDYLNRANQKYVDYAAKIDTLQQSKEQVYDEWFQAKSSAFDKFNIDSNKHIEDLKKLYREQLKLEAPAKYWSERAKKLRTEGYRWLAALVLTVIAGIIALIWSLSEISNGTLEKIFQNNGTAIKWSVVFITLISFIAFTIKIFSKLTFSSFHLVRDAEEREQLTYVYLALQKEKGIDQTERHLVMQSLFSRADSGLLKDDSTPTMPGNIADKIISR